MLKLMEEWKLVWFSWIIWWRRIFEFLPKKDTHLLLFYDLQMAREERWKEKKLNTLGLIIIALLWQRVKQQLCETYIGFRPAAGFPVSLRLRCCCLRKHLPLQRDSIYALLWSLHPSYALLQPIYPHMDK